MRPYGNESLIADLLGMMRASSPRDQLGLDERSVTALWTTGGPATLTEAQRLAFSAVVVASMKACDVVIDVAKPTSDQDKRRLLARLAEQDGLRLTDPAWDRIEALDDDALDFTIGLVSHARGQLDKVLLRRAIFENPALLEFCLELSRDPAAVERAIHAKLGPV